MTPEGVARISQKQTSSFSLRIGARVIEADRPRQ
jgi:hypothetical protein